MGYLSFSLLFSISFTLTLFMPLSLSMSLSLTLTLPARCPLAVSFSLEALFLFLLGGCPGTSNHQSPFLPEDRICRHLPTR